jgi:hypothetical protein
MGHHPMGSGVDPNPRFLSERLVGEDALVMGTTAERIHDRFPQLTKERSDRYALASQQKTAAAYEAGKIQRDLVPVAIRTDEGWGPRDPRRGHASRDHARGPRDAQDPVPPARPHHRGQRVRPQRRCDRGDPRVGRRREGARPHPQDEARELRLRGRRPRDHGHRTHPGHREGAAQGRACRSTTSTSSR